MQTKTETIGPMWISILLTLSVVTAAPALSQSLQGVWRSQGYGYVFEVLGSEQKTFEVTSTTCVAGFTARLQPSTTAGEDSLPAAPSFVVEDPVVQLAAASFRPLAGSALEHPAGVTNRIQ